MYLGGLIATFPSPCANREEQAQTEAIPGDTKGETQAVQRPPCGYITSSCPQDGNIGCGEFGLPNALVQVLRDWRHPKGRFFFDEAATILQQYAVRQ